MPNFINRMKAQLDEDHRKFSLATWFITFNAIRSRKHRRFSQIAYAFTVYLQSQGAVSKNAYGHTLERKKIISPPPHPDGCFFFLPLFVIAISLRFTWRDH